MGEGHSNSVPQCGRFLVLSLSFLFLFTLVLNMFVQENTVTVVQEFHRPLPKMPDEPDSSQEDLSKKLPKNCQPQTKLAFAKTHKTGGKFTMFENYSKCRILNFVKFHQFLSYQNYLSGNTVWPQVSGF